MSAALNDGLAGGARRFVLRNLALVGMPALLVFALAFTIAIHPDFGAFDVQSLALGALPLAFAAAAQAIVVISGGIDLSVGSLMAVSNVLAASTMQHASFPQSLALAALNSRREALQGAANGLIVVISRIPDVVVTLTTGFIWGGVALLILEKPGGGAPPCSRSRRQLACLSLAAECDYPARRRGQPHLAAGQPQPARPAHLCDRQRPRRRLSQRRRRRQHAHSGLRRQRPVQRAGRSGFDDDDGHRRAARRGCTLCASRQRGCDRHRRRPADGGPRRHGRARHRGVPADADPDHSHLPRHRPQLRPGDPGHAHRARRRDDRRFRLLGHAGRK